MRCIMQQKEIVLLAARYADAKKAENIKVLDLQGLSSLCQYIVLATVTSKPHLEAVEEEISTQLKKIGVYKTNRDGADSVMWRVADYGSFLVHLMTPQARDFYSLDKIFSFGKELNYKKPAKKTTSKKAPARKTATQKAAKQAAAKKTSSRITAKKSPVKKTKKSPAKKTVKKSAK